MHKLHTLLLVILLFQQVLSHNLDKLVGYYNISNDCSSWICGKSYVGQNYLQCPLAGNNGEIKKLSHNKYQLNLLTYYLISLNGQFSVEFSDENFINSQEPIIQIQLDQDEFLNFVPCYNGEQTHEYCENQIEKPQIIFWKTHGKDVLHGCQFIAQKYVRQQDVQL